MNSVRIACAALAGALLAGAGQATTYVVDPMDVPGATISGTISTDGTLGTLGYGNFTGLDLTITDGVTSGHLDFSNLWDLANAGSNTVLTATSEGLFFDFSSNAAQGFLALNGATGTALCFTAGGISCAGVAHSEVFELNYGLLQGPQLSGLTRIAHVEAVPEPASWALMLGGFGLVGGALRSRRKAQVAFG